MLISFLWLLFCLSSNIFLQWSNAHTTYNVENTRKKSAIIALNYDRSRIVERANRIQTRFVCGPDDRIEIASGVGRLIVAARNSSCATRRLVGGEEDETIGERANSRQIGEHRAFDEHERRLHANRSTKRHLVDRRCLVKVRKLDTCRRRRLSNVDASNPIERLIKIVLAHDPHV